MTVAIPTFGARPRYLAEAIESVLGQTMGDIEVFVSNDGPDGETSDLVGSFVDPRLEYLRQPIPTLHANLNHCLSLGSAPFLAICQDDDFWLPHNLERLVETMDRHPEVGLAHAAMRVIDQDGYVLHEWKGPRELANDTVEPGAIFIRRSMASVNRVNMSSALIRREILRNDRFQTADDTLCDTGLWMRLARRGDVAFLAEPLTALRAHADTASVREGINDELRRPTLHEIRLTQHVKKRFLAEIGYEGAELEELRALAQRWGQRQLLNIVVETTSPARSPVATLRGLREAVRIEPSLLGRLRTWRVFLASLVGSRGRRVARRLLRPPRPTAAG
ncbi:MAG: glycosyltransferase [Acidimicrobiia bacterium]